MCKKALGNFVKSKSKCKSMKSREWLMSRPGPKQCDVLRSLGSSVTRVKEWCQVSEVETSLGGLLRSEKKLKTTGSQATVFSRGRFALSGHKI